MHSTGGGWLAQIFLHNEYELTSIFTIESASEGYPVVLVVWLSRVVN